MCVCLQEVTAPSSAAAVDTSSAAGPESEPEEPKDTEPEDTVGLTRLLCTQHNFCFVLLCSFCFV